MVSKLAYYAIGLFCAYTAFKAGVVGTVLSLSNYFHDEDAPALTVWTTRIVLLSVWYVITTYLFGNTIDKILVGRGGEPYFHLERWVFVLADQQWVFKGSEEEATNFWENATSECVLGEDAKAFFRWRRADGVFGGEYLKKRLWSAARKACEANDAIDFDSLPKTLGRPGKKAATPRAKPAPAPSHPDPTPSPTHDDVEFLDTHTIYSKHKKAMYTIKLAEYSFLTATLKDLSRRIETTQHHELFDEDTVDYESLRKTIGRSELGRKAKKGPPADTPTSLHLVDPTTYTATFREIEARLSCEAYDADPRRWASRAGRAAIIRALPCKWSIALSTIVNMYKHTHNISVVLGPTRGEGGELDFDIYFLLNIM